MAEPSNSESSALTSLLSRPVVVMPLLAIATLSLVWANWNSPFYSYDDADHLQQATETPFSNCLRFDNDQTFLPVASLSLRLDRALFGPPFSEPYFRSSDEGGAPLDQAKFKAQRVWATLSRVENTLLHLIAGIVLWLFLRRIGASPGIALLTAVAWTGHPMACESVCWISERKNVLSALFGFAALLAWTAGGGAWWRWPLLSSLYLLSTLSKPTGVGFFPVIAALEILHPNSEQKPEFPRLAARLALPTLITCLIVWIGLKTHQVHFVEHAGGSLSNALLTDLEIFSRYIFNMIFPVNLSFFYGIEPIISLADWRAWVFGALLLTTLTGLLWITRGTERTLAVFGLIWFFATLGPVSNIAPIPFWMQDRYVYCGSAGMLLAFACAGLSLLRRVNLERLAPALATIFLTAILVLAGARSSLFADSDLLCFDAAERYPNSSFALVNAYTSARARIDTLSRSPNLPPQAKADALKFYNEKASEYFNAVVRRNDLTHFREEFLFRVVHAELLLDSGQLEQALLCLKGFLPPVHLKMRRPDQKFLASEIKEYYAPQTLARAWLIQAQVRLSQANPPGVPLIVLPAQRRFELCDEAASALAKASAAFDWNQQAPFLNAAVDLTRAEIAKLDNQTAASKTFADSARKKLEAIPQSSPFFGGARQLLQSLGGQP